jgi:hypothetical protein
MRMTKNMQSLPLCETYIKLISCLTDCLCNLGSKYNGRICPGFINNKSGKQSYPQ